MPLSPPSVARELAHTRRVECRGWRRADGLWDIEARLLDTKTYPVSGDDRGTVAAGMPIHDMWLRLTVDDELVIRAAEAVTDDAPYRICPEAAPNFRRLEGLSIRPGFTAKLRQVLSRAEACTHLVELLGPLATTAFQTVQPGWSRAGRPAIIDSCIAYASDGEVVRSRLPQFYTGDRPEEPR
jgi:hypothetical protein